MAKPRIFRYSRFNLDALLALGYALRGQPCISDKSKPPMAGSLNWADLVSFDDGVECILRSPRSGRDTHLSDESACRMLASEAATLKYIRAHSLAPVPQVLSSRTGLRAFSLAIRLASSSPPTPLICIAKPAPTALRGRPGEGHESARGIVIVSQLSQHRFEKVGSLFQDSDNNYSVGECLSPSLIWRQGDSLDGTARGPFNGGRAYLESLISAYISHGLDTASRAS
ncbi:kinase-like domain [Zalerion maritima]|uniref:Kinase-like domain n=1 Tax=Zalerion maritima TaxID=339359 RepID=A0AAD5RNG2_9PEZI|nr:kinase-like domain [Zalerion maritima]